MNISSSIYVSLCFTNLIRKHEITEEDDVNDTIQIFCRTSIFSEPSIGFWHLTLQVKPSDTVENVKIKVQQKGIPPDCRFEFINRGRQLDDRKTLCDYEIGNHSTIELMGRFRSCRCPQNCC